MLSLGQALSCCSCLSVVAVFGLAGVEFVLRSLLAASGSRLILKFCLLQNMVHLWRILKIKASIMIPHSLSTFHPVVKLLFCLFMTYSSLEIILSIFPL
jgi:hypothetical protein